jgi:hypothetical protein
MRKQRELENKRKDAEHEQQLFRKKQQQLDEQKRVVQQLRSNGPTFVQNVEENGRVGGNSTTNITNPSDLEPRGSFASLTYAELLAEHQSKTRYLSRRGWEEKQKDVNLKRKESMGTLPYGGYFFHPLPKAMLDSSQRDKPHDQRVNEYLYRQYGRHY